MIESPLQDLPLLFPDHSPPSWSGANVHSSTPLILISGGVEFPLKLMKGPFEIQAVIVLKWRTGAWKGREKGSFLKNRMEELQYNMSIKAMSTCCQFGLIQPTIHSNVLRMGNCCDTRHADIGLH